MNRKQYDHSGSVTLADLRLIRGHSFVSSLLVPGDFIIDAGAHKLEFASQIASEYSVKVIALEPNNDLIPLSQHQNIIRLDAALWTSDAIKEFEVRQNLEASTIVPEKSPPGGSKRCVPTRSIQSLMQEYNIDHLALLKLDIEGAEYGVIEQLDYDYLSRIRQITIEFHPFNPTKSQTAEIRKIYDRLRSAEFFDIKSSTRGYGDILFVNTKYISKPSRIINYMVPIWRKIEEKFPNYKNMINSNL